MKNYVRKTQVRWLRKEIWVVNLERNAEAEGQGRGKLVKHFQCKSEAKGRVVIKQIPI